MLIDVLIAQYVRFAALAEDCLAAGATAFGVWNNDLQLADWPSRPLNHASSIAAPARLRERSVGDLRVADNGSAESHPQPPTQASLVANLVELVEALRGLTA